MFNWIEVFSKKNGIHIRVGIFLHIFLHICYIGGAGTLYPMSSELPILKFVIFLGDVNKVCVMGTNFCSCSIHLRKM
jgi:hypothetical protein